MLLGDQISPDCLNYTRLALFMSIYPEGADDGSQDSSQDIPQET